MDRFAGLLSQLAAEHEGLREECKQLRHDAEAWRSQERLNRGDGRGEIEAKVSAFASALPDSDTTTLWARAADEHPPIAQVHQSGAIHHAPLQGPRDGSEVHILEHIRLNGGSLSPSGDLGAVLSKEVDRRYVEGKGLGVSISQESFDASYSLDDTAWVKSDAAPEVQGSVLCLPMPAPASGESIAYSGFKGPVALEAHAQLDALPGDDALSDCHWDSQSGLARLGNTLSPPRGEGVNESALTLWPLWASYREEGEADEVIKELLAGSFDTELHADAGAEAGWPQSCLQALVMRPSSAKRIVWDLLSIGVLFYDIMSIPMLAFSSGQADPLPKRVLDFVTTVFWTMNIPFSFLSGFHNGGVVEMRLSSIARRYLKGWFVLDFPIVLLDWTVILLQSGSFQEFVGSSRVTKLLRASRVLRLFRLLRMLRLPSWAEGIGDSIRSDGLKTSLGVMRSLMIIAIASHFIACAWYFISGLHRPFTWVQLLDDEQRDLAYRYTTALHWSVTQFTPASMEVVPLNTPERVFAVLVILSAMVAFSCFVSSITQAMANLQRAHMEQDKQESNMRRYVIENSITLDLAHRMTRFMRAQNAMARRRLHEGDVQIFKFLPDSVRQELHCQVYLPILLLHPLFQRTLNLDNTFLIDVCHKAMSEISLGFSEELFQPGQEAMCTFFTRSGIWNYSRLRQPLRREGTNSPRSTRRLSTPNAALSRSNSVEGDHDLTVVKGESCVCEVALWLQWNHRGYLVAETPCEGVSLDTNGFRKIASRKPRMVVALREYAIKYHERLVDEAEFFELELGFLAAITMEIVRQSFEDTGSTSPDGHWSRFKPVSPSVSLVSHSMGMRRFKSSSSTSNGERSGTMRSERSWTMRIASDRSTPSSRSS